MTDVAFIISAALAKAKLAIAIEKVNRFPSGTPGGKGGQFAPMQSGGFGGKAELPATAKPHPKKGEKGEDVMVHYPSRAGDPAAWGKADAVATAVPGGPVPDSLHGIPFTSWKPPADWTKVSGTNPKIDQDEPFDYAPEQRPGSGVVIVEPDGRMWITKPTNGFGGYVHQWPKGGLEDGLNLQQNAIKEAWEETGLKVNITGLLGDYDGDTSKARYYVAQRVGGTPADMGWETQAMRLVPASKLKTLLNRSRDKAIADNITALLKMEGIAKAKGKAGVSQQPRWPAGSPLGGQWKGYDGGGIPTPPKIAGGLEGKNTVYQKQVNALYSAFKANELKMVSAAVEALKVKVDANAAKGAKSSHVKWAAQVHQYGQSLLDSGKVKTKAEATATALDGPASISDWKFLKDKSMIGGSAPGGLYEAKGGGTYLVKGNASKAVTGAQVSDDRAKNEVLASKLLTAVGAGSPEMKLVNLGDKHGGGLGVATKWMDGLTKFNPGNKAHLAAAQSQFAIHAWLGNYDVIGATFDNTMITKDGKALCIDPGGSILFRAMGKKKDAGAFGPVAKEMESLRDPKVNANAAAVYGSMTKSQLKASADALKNIDDDTIKALVKAHGPGDQKGKDALAQTLIDRKNNILAKYGTQAPKPKAEKPTAPATPALSPKELAAIPGSAKLATAPKTSNYGKLAMAALTGDLAAAQEYQPLFGDDIKLKADIISAMQAKVPATPAAPAKPAPVSPRDTPTAKPVSVEGLKPPHYKTGFKAVDAAFNNSVKYVQELHAKAITGDHDAMADFISVTQSLVQHQKITPGKDMPKKGTYEESENYQALKTYVTGMMGDAAAKYYAATQGAKSEQKAADDAKVKAEKTALPNFKAAMLPDGNTNAKSHNAKIETISQLAGKGDVKGILALNFGTNTYGKKQAQIANDALAAIGSSSKVVAGQKAGQHPDLAGGGPEIAKPAKPVSAKSKAVDLSDKPEAQYRIPNPPDFANWHGPGKPLSSVAHVNQQNQHLANQIKETAKTLNLEALVGMTFPELDKSTGQPTGKLLPISQHKSQHIVAYYADAIDALKNPYVPPKKMTAAELAAIPGIIKNIVKSVGDVSELSAASKKLGRYAILGSVDGKPFDGFPPSQVSPTIGNLDLKALYDQSNANFSKLTQTEKKAIKDYTGSGYSTQNNPETGKGSTAASHTIKALKKAGVELPEGTVLSRKFSFNNAHEANSALLAASVGSVIKDFGIISTSTSPKVWGGDTHLKITTAKGVKGLYVAPDPDGQGSAISHFPGENEIILPYGTKFYVKAVHKNTKQKPHADKTGQWGKGSSMVVELVALPMID